MKKEYKLTAASCYMGYVCQALVVNFFPLLYVYFNQNFGISFEQLAIISLFMFAVQMSEDFLSTLLVGKLSFKFFALSASISIILGFILLTILPFYMNPFFGIMIACFFTSLGGGLLEVVVSPVMDKISNNSTTMMNLLHGMYGFGVFAVIMICFGFYAIFGIENWRILGWIMTIIPIVCLIMFSICKYPETGASEKFVTTSSKPFYKKPAFYWMGVVMIAAGAAEVGIAQWISSYAEVGLGVVKPYGDVYGPALFALAQGSFRIIYAFMSRKIKMEKILVFSGFVTIAGYLIATLPNNGVINFIGAIIIAIGIAPMWPGCLSLISRKIGDDNPKIFTAMALFGDIGCVAGVYTIGAFIDKISFKFAILLAVIYPILFLFALMLLRSKKRKS